ncbi:MAG: DNA replication/repair protein RecF [Pseudomonadota bacterium]
MTPVTLSAVTLSHFRSYTRAEIETDGKSVALFGPNGAGKTNVLEAISMLSPGRGLRRAAAEDLSRQPEAIGWKITALLAAQDRTHELETFSEGAASRTTRIDGKPAPQLSLGRLSRILWLVPAMDRLWSEGADGRRRFLDRIAMSFEPSHAEAVLTYEKAMRERNRLLKEQTRDPAWYRGLEAQMARAGSRIQNNRDQALLLLHSAQDEADTTFPTADLALTNADETALPEGEDALFQAIADSRPRDLAAGRSLIGPHRADLAATYRAKGVAAKHCSTGEQKALLISLVLANARALARDFQTPPILLLDEVAAHLDAGRRQALYTEIRALGCQAWMTGTGPELFDGLQDALRLSVQERTGTSVLETV